jgi:hypothetical protein
VTVALELVDLQFSEAFLARHDLPNGLYPVTEAAMEQIIAEPDRLPFAEMLFGLQLRASEGQADWQAHQPALLRLAALVAPSDDRLSIEVGGDTWWL